MEGAEEDRAVLSAAAAAARAIDAIIEPVSEVGVHWPSCEAGDDELERRFA